MAIYKTIYLHRVRQRFVIYFYSEITENNETTLCKTIDGIVADVSVFVHVSGLTEGRPVEEIVRIFIEAHFV